MRDTNEGAVVDVTADLPLGNESDLIPGGALPLELIHDRVGLVQESNSRDGVSVLDGSSFAEGGVRGVEVRAREGFHDGFAGVDVVRFDQQTVEGEAVCESLGGCAVFRKVPGVTGRLAGVGGVTRNFAARG